MDVGIDRPSTCRLARSQAARRARVLEMALQLAEEGGYDAIQLRPIQDRTAISSDTIYRYFGSRDQLIFAALELWTEREGLTRAPDWIEGVTAAEQLLSNERHMWQVWERNPNVLETWVRAALAEDGSEAVVVARVVRALGPTLTEILRDVDPDYRDDLLIVIQQATFSTMAHVVRGQLDIRNAYPQIERTIRRLAQHPAMDGHRPKSWDWKPRPKKLRTRS